MLQMTTKFKAGLLAAAMVGAVGLGGAGAAFASPASDESAEVAAVMAAKTSPVDAVRAAEASAGGRAVSMGLEAQGSAASYYEVLVSSPNGLQEVRLDPATGAVQGATKAGTKALEDLKAGQVDQATSAPVTLGQAITAAEQAAGGRALEAGYTIRDGQPVCTVEVITKDGVRQVSVNATNAKVALANPADTESGESGADSD